MRGGGPGRGPGRATVAASWAVVALTLLCTDGNVGLQVPVIASEARLAVDRYCTNRSLTPQGCASVWQDVARRLRGAALGMISDPSRLGSIPVLLDQRRAVQLVVPSSGEAVEVDRAVGRFCSVHNIAFGECDRLHNLAVRRTAEAQADVMDRVIAAWPQPLGAMAVADSAAAGLPSDADSASIARWAMRTGRTAIDGLLRRLAETREELDAKSAALVALQARHRAETASLKRQLALQSIRNEAAGAATNGPDREARDGTAGQQGRSLREGAWGVDEGPWLWDYHRRPVQRIHHRNLSIEDYRRFAARGEPLVITGLPLPPWGAARLRSECGSREVVLKRTERGSAKRPIHTTVKRGEADQAATRAGNSAAIRGVNHHDDQNGGKNGDDDLAANRTQMAQLYLHDASVAKFCPSLLDSMIIPRYFKDDLMQRVPNAVHPFWRNWRDYWPSIFIGGNGTTSSLHADWGNTAAWMGLIEGGRKRWRIATRNSTPLLYPTIRPGNSNNNQFDGDLFAPDAAQHPASAEAAGYWHTEQMPGEVIFLPSGSAHQVHNVGEAATVAVAFNFVDPPVAHRFQESLESLADGATGSERQFYRQVAHAFVQLQGAATGPASRAEEGEAGGVFIGEGMQGTCLDEQQHERGRGRDTKVFEGSLRKHVAPGPCSHRSSALSGARLQKKTMPAVAVPFCDFKPELSCS